MSSDTAKGTGNNTPIGRIHRFLIPIEDVFNLIAAAAIFGLMVLGVLQITLRSIFNKPIVGYIDLVELSMATMAFLGAAYCQRLASHIRMEILIGRLRGRFLWFVEAAGLLAAMFIISVLIWYGWDLFEISFRQNEGSDSMTGLDYRWFIKFFVPLGFIIAMMATLATLIRLAAYLFGDAAQKADARDKLEIFADGGGALEEARLEAERILREEAEAAARLKK